MAHGLRNSWYVYVNLSMWPEANVLKHRLKKNNVQKRIYIIKVALSVCLFVCLYPSSAHSFSLIGMKLGMDTPWDLAGDMV